MSDKDSEQFKAAMRRRFEAQLTPLEHALLEPPLLQLAFDYYLEGWLAATIPEYDADTDVLDQELSTDLSTALRKITPERLNELLKLQLKTS